MSYYSQVLDKAIRDSGKTLKDIAAECKNRGVSIDITSLSKMRSGEQAPPPTRGWNDEGPSKNHVLAEVLGLDPKELELIAGLQATPPVVLLHIEDIALSVNEQGKLAAMVGEMARTVIEWAALHLPEESSAIDELRQKFVALWDTHYRQITTSTLLFEVMRPVLENMKSDTGHDLQNYTRGRLLKEDKNSFLILTQGLASLTGVPVRALRAFIRALQTEEDDGIEQVTEQQGR